MIRRVNSLAGYLFKTVITSLSGAVYFLAAGVLYFIFFNPLTGDVPEPDYFILLLSLFGGAVAFLGTLTVASIANRPESNAIFVRLPSRIEYLTGVLLASLGMVVLIQFLLGLIIMIQPSGPELGFGRIMTIPPIWLSINLFAIVLALHASDFVMTGWSRVYTFGILTVLLFVQSIDLRGVLWITERFNSLATWASQQGLSSLAQNARSAASWVTQNGADFFQNTIGFVFWPFRAIAQATRNGLFDNAQALAPAILILYATILFMLAADIFANKDLYFSE